MAEISSQPAAIRRAAEGLTKQLPTLDRVPGVRGRQDPLFTGMGGSYDLCYAPVTALGLAGVAAAMVDSAELLYFRRNTLSPESALVIASQSGESAEVVRLVREIKADAHRPILISVTNGLENSLAGLVDVTLDTKAGPEQGPSTLTFASALVVMAALTHVLVGRPAVEAVQRTKIEAERAACSIEAVLGGIVAKAERLGDWLGDRVDLYLLARGTHRAASEMGALTLKEAARFHAESMQTAQFRHGPLEVMGSTSAVIVFATQESKRDVDLRLARELVAMGVPVLIISDTGEKVEGAECVTLGIMDDVVAPAVSLVPIQLLAWRLAMDRGISPGTYFRGSKVTCNE